MNRREHVSRAEALLASGESHDLAYAALELRMAMETIAYEKLRLYAPRLPEEVLSKWQPPQAMRALLEFEPDAMKERGLRIAVNGPDGKPVGPWQDLGVARSFRLDWLRKNYNKLGNLLHVQSPKAKEATGSRNSPKLRSDLAEILGEVKRVAESPLTGAMAAVIDFKCAACDTPTLFNEDGAKKTNRAVCISCNAEHHVVFEADGRPAMYLMTTDFDCVACKALTPIENRLLEIGFRFKCASCKAPHVFVNMQWGYGMETQGAVGTEDRKQPDK
jgi:hypothetical protein